MAPSYFLVTYNAAMTLKNHYLNANTILVIVVSNNFLVSFVHSQVRIKLKNLATVILDVQIKILLYRLQLWSNPVNWWRQYQ